MASPDAVPAAPVAGSFLPSPSSASLVDAVAAVTAAHPRQSGLYALADARDAFAARVLLADAARETLDVQYYIWHNDMSGTLLFDALRRAADRGVHVRLLLDDNNTIGLDAVLAELDAHRNIEVRLFNPFHSRRWRLLGYLTDFRRLNRRMHNKSFTADGRATIVGGRNVGDEYFGAHHDLLFVDLDVLAIGAVVNEVSQDFERYWTSRSAHPASRVVPVTGGDEMDAVNAAAWRVQHEAKTRAYTEAIARPACVAELLAGRLPLEWTTATVVSDDPAKGLGRARERELLTARLDRILQTPAREMQLISPYFVPTAAGAAAFASLARQGVAITVLTNALESTDVVAVHAGYAKRRRALLAAGVTLFEVKRTWPARLLKDRPRGRASSSSSLHAKTFSIDRSRVFVGSFNFDPRSARLNTEMGFVIDSPSMAEQLADRFAGPIPERSYRVRIGALGRLEWVEQTEAGDVVHRHEPGAHVWRRAALFVLAHLPIEWLL